MKEIMQGLDQLSKRCPVELQKQKKAGKKVIEYSGNFIPEEMITAAGAGSYLMCRGGDPEPPEAVLDYMLRFMNPLARSLAGYYLLGMDAVTPIADLMLMQQTDCHVGRISEVLEYKKLPVYKVGVPADWNKDIARDYYRKELREMRAKIEELVGHSISDDDIRANYAKTNKINELLRKISDLRKKDNPPIGFCDFILLNHYSFRVDYDTMIDALTKIYDKLKDAPGIFPENSPRILLMGHAVAIGDYVVPRILEDAGGAIVSDFLDEGIRVYNSDISTEGDVVDAFVQARYIDNVPIDIFQPSWETRFEYAKKLIAENRIDGVVWYQLAFDEIYDMEYTCLSKWMGEINMPLLKLESSYEYSREAMAPLTTRLESFVESLKEAK